MLRRAGVVVLSLLCMIAFASPALAAEQEPTVSELQEFAQMTEEEKQAAVDERLKEAQQQLEAGRPYVAQEILTELADEELTDEQTRKLTDMLPQVEDAIEAAEGEAQEQVAAEAAPTEEQEQERARQLLEEYRQRARVEEQLDRAKAEELVQRAEELLYYENKPREAYELAERALSLNPDSKRAADIKTEAGLLLPPGPARETARRKFLAEQGIQLPDVRLQRATQTLENSLAKARQAYAEEEYEQALEQLRKARSYVELLAVHRDVSARRQ